MVVHRLYTTHKTVDLGEVAVLSGELIYFGFLSGLVDGQRPSGINVPDQCSLLEPAACIRSKLNH